MYLSSFSLLLLRLLWLYHRAGTFVGHYLADTKRQKKNRFASAAAPDERAMMIIVWGGEGERKAQRIAVVLSMVLLLLLFSSNTKLRARFALWTSALIIKIRESLFSLYKRSIRAAALVIHQVDTGYSKSRDIID